MKLELLDLSRNSALGVSGIIVCVSLWSRETESHSWKEMKIRDFIAAVGLLLPFSHLIHQSRALVVVGGGGVLHVSTKATGSAQDNNCTNWFRCQNDGCRSVNSISVRVRLLSLASCEWVGEAAFLGSGPVQEGRGWQGEACAR